MMTMTTTNVREKGDKVSEVLVHPHKNPRSLYHIEQVCFTEYTTSIRSDYKVLIVCHMEADGKDQWFSIVISLVLYRPWIIGQNNKGIGLCA